jgi:hypothetical protein
MATAAVSDGQQEAKNPASIRHAFAERFGDDQAEAIYAAAREHRNGVHDNEGSDPFKWALLICIGFECMSSDAYRGGHGITAPWDEIKQWIKDHADLASHDGDCDYITMFTGGYDEYMPQRPDTEAA